MAVGLSDVYGRPGPHAVASWSFAELVEAAVVVEAYDGARRYAERRAMAEGAL